nr:hypothetical protein SHINE37_42856 [Rhizobiaceae bacterium]
MNALSTKRNRPRWRAGPVDPGARDTGSSGLGSGGRDTGRRHRPRGGGRIVEETADRHTRLVCRGEALGIQIPHGIFDSHELQPILIGNDDADGLTTDFDNLLLHNNSCRTEGTAHSNLALKSKRDVRSHSAEGRMRFPCNRFTTGVRHTHGGDAVDIVHDTLPLVGADALKWTRQSGPG